MNLRGGCCIARYGGSGGGAGGYDMSKVDRIMLRFRPIAPRPTTGGSCSPLEKSGSAIVSAKSCRGKRRYNKENTNSSGSASSNGNNSKRCNKRRREETKDRSGDDGAAVAAAEVVTLPLLPETPEKKVAPSLAEVKPMEWSSSPAFCLSFRNDRSNGFYQKASDLTTDAMTAMTEESVLSCVTVECIIDTWMEGQYGIGITDEEKKMNLDKDTCPGFISDCEGKVTWTNDAYRDLVAGHQNVGYGEITVWLVMRERPMLTYTAFTCRVRLEYTCRDKEKSSITLPCDVWKMNEGGFAWRLDVNAALCLGL